jgi:hypothetical protein
VLTVQSDLDQRPVEHLAARTTRARPCDLLITGLLADQHDARWPDHGRGRLGGVAEEIAAHNARWRAGRRA